MPKGEKRVESRITGLSGVAVFAQANCHFICFLYGLCYYLLSFPEPFTALNNLCVDKLVYDYSLCWIIMLDA